MAKAWIGSLVGLSSSPGAARTPQCHDDVITAVGAEAFAPRGAGVGLICHTEASPAGLQNALFSLASPRSRQTVDFYLEKV